MNLAEKLAKLEPRDERERALIEVARKGVALRGKFGARSLVAPAVYLEVCDFDDAVGALDAALTEE